MFTTSHARPSPLHMLVQISMLVHGFGIGRHMELKPSTTTNNMHRFSPWHLLCMLVHGLRIERCACICDPSHVTTHRSVVINTLYGGMKLHRRLELLHMPDISYFSMPSLLCESVRAAH